MYIDGLKGQDEYKREKKRLEEKLFDLVVPGMDAVEEAGKLLGNLPNLWRKAGLSDRHLILMTMLDAVYVECREEKRIVAIKPKPAFRPLFDIANTRSGSGVVLIKEEAPAHGGTGAPTDSCSWWRRGREPVSEVGVIFGD